MPFGSCWANPMLSAWAVSVRGWANSNPPDASPWRKSRPLPCYWPILSRSVSGILAGAGSIPCYRHGIFVEGLGQLNATGSLTLEQLWAISIMTLGRSWANPTLLAMLVSREAGSIPCYWHGLFGEGPGQLKATGSLALEQLWANSMLLAMPVSREAGSIPCYQHCIFRGSCLSAVR